MFSFPSLAYTVKRENVKELLITTTPERTMEKLEKSLGEKNYGPRMTESRGTIKQQ